MYIMCITITSLPHVQIRKNWRHFFMFLLYSIKVDLKNKIIVVEMNVLYTHIIIKVENKFKMKC